MKIIPLVQPKRYRIVTAESTQHYAHLVEVDKNGKNIDSNKVLGYTWITEVDNRTPKHFPQDGKMRNVEDGEILHLYKR